jgi:prophage regulatory protein
MPEGDRILRRPEVVRETGLRRSSIYERMAAKTFPRSVPLGGRAVGWLEAEIIDWKRKREAERNKREAEREKPAAPKRRRQ